MLGYEKEESPTIWMLTVYRFSMLNYFLLLTTAIKNRKIFGNMNVFSVLSKTQKLINIP